MLFSSYNISMNIVNNRFMETTELKDRIKLLQDNVEGGMNSTEIVIELDRINKVVMFLNGACYK